MYIKSLIIDGFKSYGRRTEVTGFDHEFTAITGLNGSGKSNMLDAICFVLGLTSLANMRSNSLQDLIYKSGQTGIKKATVTLVFDNTDPSQSPLGYERCNEISIARQIVAGGKNKYFINGRIVLQKKVTDFFCSVQLNVNNANFLIMQGRIAKLMNARPEMILSMIEEAAGTSMYEAKRESSTKLIEKKEQKVNEMNTLLEEELLPKLEKLREERAAYQEYQKLCRDIDFLTRIHISYRYSKQRKAIEHIAANIEKISSRIETCRKTITENEEEAERIDGETKTMQDQIDGQAGGELKEAEEELSQLQVKEATASGSLKAQQASIDQEEKKLRGLSKSIEDDKKALQQKEAAMAKVEGSFESLKEAAARDLEAYEEAQRKFEAISQGLTTNEDGKTSTLQEQLITYKQQLSKAQTTLKTAEMELRHKRSLLRKKENESQSSDAAYENDKRLYDQLDEEIKKLEAQLQELNYQEGLAEELQTKRNQLHQEVRRLKNQLDELQANQYEFRYQDPEPNFDRSKVHDIVGKMFTVTDDTFYQALSTAMGGHALSVIVGDELTGKKILSKGNLKKRVTIIPLNKIQAHPVPKRKIEFAQRLAGKDNVIYPLSIIDYKPCYETVFQYVLGHTLICRTLDVAKEVTYHRDVFCRTVTLDGDVLEPQGTLSGGSSKPTDCLLLKIAKVKKLEDSLEAAKRELAEVERKLGNVAGLARTYNKLKETLGLRHSDFEACKLRLSMTTFQQHQDDIRSLQEEIAVLETELHEAKDTQQCSQVKIKEVEDKLADTKGYRERELKAASAAMKEVKKKADASNDKWKKHEQEFKTFKLEIEELRTGISKATEQLEKSQNELDKLKADLDQRKEDSLTATLKVQELKRKIKQHKDEINAQNRELKNLLVKKEKLEKQNVDLTVEIKKKENELSKTQNENRDSFKKLEAYEEKYPWILEDRDFFGVRNTRYDYSKEDPVKAGQKLQQMQDQKNKMERHINMRSMTLLERQEEEYKETVRRKEIVEEDKRKLCNIIDKMDENKREKIEEAWVAVNEHFSSIFGTLLEGAQAKLEAVKQGDQLLGLEFKVGFNGVWKESLGELSGGQRSLVSLSFLLAMLKFSPAPLYILDEVDAALDMSHTQNIGTMFRTHFKGSQFIVVSLKDGMFSNANVLFRTKFEDGVTSVSRTCNVKGKR